MITRAQKLTQGHYPPKVVPFKKIYTQIIQPGAESGTSYSRTHIHSANRLTTDVAKTTKLICSKFGNNLNLTRYTNIGTNM